MLMKFIKKDKFGKTVKDRREYKNRDNCKENSIIGKY